MATDDLTAQRLRELLDYDPATGDFRWLGRRRGAPKNRPPGCINGEGYRCITVDGVLHGAHRLAWLHVCGSPPSGVIDHINGIKTDNRIENLRDVSETTNRQNQRKASARSKSGLLGVVWDANRERWKALLYVGKIPQWIGRFDTPEEAHAAYLEAKRRLHAGCTI